MQRRATGQHAGFGLVALLLAACGGGGIEGSYEMDENAVRAAAMEWLSKNPLPPGTSREVFDKQLEEAIEAQMAERTMALELKPDGTYVLAVRMGAESTEVKGTWKREGPKLTMVTTHENGEERKDPDSVEAEYADGRITLREKMEYPLVFKKKE